jgi:hypothetical protein
MSERDTQIQRDVGVDVDVGIDDSTEETTDRGGGVRGWLRSKAESVVSTRGLLVSLVLTTIGVVFLGGLIPLPLGIVGDALGIFVAAFLYGLVAGESRYLELGLSGAAVGGAWALLGNLVLTLVGPGLPIVLVGVLGGALGGVSGHYFGRDLRKGLTQDLDAESGPR